MDNVSSLADRKRIKELEERIEHFEKALLKIRERSKYPADKKFERALMDVNDIATEALEHKTIQEKNDDLYLFIDVNPSYKDEGVEPFYVEVRSEKDNSHAEYLGGFRTYREVCLFAHSEKERLGIDRIYENAKVKFKH